MEQVTGTHEQLFQLIPTKEYPGVNSNILTLGRYLVGRTETCDVVIPVKGISAVHAVLEVTPRGIKVYDMNSKNGTLVDGNKVVAKGVELNGRLTFGKVEFVLKKYNADPELPPVLPSLEPSQGRASILKTPRKPKLPKIEKQDAVLPEKLPEIADDVPYIVYPLAADPNSAYSEYIFEDTKDLYPIFKYEHSKQSVEVIILYKDKVYSVDYLPEKDGSYKISGLSAKKNEVEFPYLAANESVPFVEIQKGNCNVHQLHSYEILHLVNDNIQKTNHGTVNLQEDDIIKLVNGDLEIYVRKVSSPPKVKTPPFFRRDKDLRKYAIFMFLIVFLPLLALNLYEVDEEVKDDKDPERIATILYKQKLKINKNKTVESSKKKPVKKQTAPKKPAIKKTEPKKTQATPQKSNDRNKKPTPNPGSKSAVKRQQVKAVKNPAPKRQNNAKTANSAKSTNSRTRSASVRRANVNSKSKGRVETYKSFNFKSTVSSLMAKGGSIRGAQTAKTSSGNISSSQVSGGVATNVRKASVGTQVGSLTGSTTGKLAETKGTSGLSTKTGVYTAGIPSETVVLGSMDPDVIRRILRDNIPFFRSCYQKELNKNNAKDISGTIRLVFTIGSSGHVSRAGVDGRTRLPGNVKKCVVRVLRGIKFPQPMGGGTVDVKQPFNFYPKKL